MYVKEPKSLLAKSMFVISGEAGLDSTNIEAIISGA